MNGRVEVLKTNKQETAENSTPSAHQELQEITHKREQKEGSRSMDTALNRGIRFTRQGDCSLQPTTPWGGVPDLGAVFLSQSHSFQFGFVLCLHLVPLLQYALWKSERGSM